MPFSEDLASLCQREMSRVRRDPEGKVEMIERLIHSLATTAVFVADGNDRVLSDLLMGAESHLNETASEMRSFFRAAGR